MLTPLIWLSCLLLVAGTDLQNIFLTDMACRYYAYHLAHKYWDSEPVRLKEYGRAYRLCVMKIFRPSSIDLLTDLFTDAVGGGRKAYGILVAWYKIIAPQASIMQIVVESSAQAKSVLHVTRSHNVVVCIGSNGNTFTRGELGGLFDEVVFLNYGNGRPDVERIAERMAAFQREAVPEATIDRLIAFYHKRLARCPSVLLKSTIPKVTGTVELCLSKAITNYHPEALGADFATEFGLLYHLNRSSSLVNNDETMLAGLCNFFPNLRIVASFPYLAHARLGAYEAVPWAPPFHPIRPHQPQLMYCGKGGRFSAGLCLPLTGDIDRVTFPNYSKQKFVVCDLGPTGINPSGLCFIMLAKVTVRNPPNTRDRRLLIAHLLRSEYRSDIFDPITKRWYDSVDWCFGGRSISKYAEQFAKKEARS